MRPSRLPAADKPRRPWPPHTMARTVRTKEGARFLAHCRKPASVMPLLAASAPPTSALLPLQLPHVSCVCVPW